MAPIGFYKWRPWSSLAKAVHRLEILCEARPKVELRLQ